jgi:hypothetical protein
MRRLPLIALLLVPRSVLAQPAPPPPPPPTSMSGTAIMSPPAPPQAPPPAPPAGGLSPDEKIAIDNRFRMLEARLNTDEQIEKEQAPHIQWLRKFHVSGYVQPQFVWNVFNAAASPNADLAGNLPPGVAANDVTARPDGTTTNQTFFRIRRARLKTEFLPTHYARFVFEIDPTPVGWSGINTIVRQVEAVGVARLPGRIIEFGAGIFRVPFGAEIQENDADRPFIEHSWGEQNMFPGEYDTGARIGVNNWRPLFGKHWRGTIAVVNGQMLGEKTFSLVPDLNKGKDFVAHANYDMGPFDVGLSGLVGQGQAVDATALRFKQFTRSAANVDVAVHHAFFERLGVTRAYGELTFGTNMDRGLYYAFAAPTVPVDLAADVTDLNERALVVRLEQDLTEWVTLGARYDFYTPDTSQANDGRDTYAFVGVVHFTKGLSLRVEFNHAIDNIHRPGAPAPSRQIETVSSVFQARF